MNYPRMSAAQLPPGVAMESSQDPSVIATDWYTYSCFALNLDNQTTQILNIQIEADSDFEIIKLSQWTCLDLSEDPPTGQFYGNSDMPEVTVLLTDTGSGRQLMNVAVPIGTLFGTAQLPMILPKPKRLFARTTLQVQVSNISTAVDYDAVYLSFIGKKIFMAGR